MPLLEIKKEELTHKLNNPDLNYEEIISMSESLASVNHELEAAELRWLELSEKQ